MAIDLKKLPNAFGALFLGILKAFKNLFTPLENPVPVIIVNDEEKVIQKHIHIHKYEYSSKEQEKNQD